MFDIFGEEQPRLPATELTTTLRAQGLGPITIAHLMRNIQAVRDESIDRLAARGLKGLVTFDSSIVSGRCMGFIGPSRGGKTTTIEKLVGQLKVAFGMMARTITQNRSSSQALEDISANELVFLETLRDEWADSLWPEHVERILVIPATLDERSLWKTFEAYENCEVSRLIITKLDQKAFIGPLVEALVQFGRPLAFMTGGPGIPDDIEPASARRLGWALTRTIH